MTKNRILCYGDSNTYGYIAAGNGRRYGENIRWPQYLQKLLGDEYCIIEEGLPGRTAAEAADDEPWKNGNSVLRAVLSTHRPMDMVIIMLGTNDLKSVFERSAEEITGSVKLIVEDTLAFLAMKQNYAPQILLIAPAPLSDAVLRDPGWDFDAVSVAVSKQLAPMYEKIAEEMNLMFLDAGKHAHPADDDGIHLDPLSHRKLAEAVYEMIRDWQPETSLPHRQFMEE